VPCKIWPLAAIRYPQQPFFGILLLDLQDSILVHTNGVEIFIPLLAKYQPTDEAAVNLYLKQKR
jgi:hypothetical protein